MFVEFKSFPVAVGAFQGKRFSQRPLASDASAYFFCHASAWTGWQSQDARAIGKTAGCGVRQQMSRDPAASAVYVEAMVAPNTRSILDNG